MHKRLQFYIDGKWVDPVMPKTLDVINPATEEPIGQVSLGSKADVDKAVKAARKAFETFSQTKRKSVSHCCRKSSKSISAAMVSS
jgi:aldehyde dehydrogenase (NAD+)